MADIWPWLRWGNAPEDPTSVKERTQAYLLDLKDGLCRSMEAEAERHKDAEKRLGNVELAAIAFFINTFNEDELVKFADVHAKDKDAAVMSFMTKFGGHLHTAIAEEIKAAPNVMDR